MTETVIITRPSTEVPFGFKLQGGADFSTPLSILSVAPGSVADLAGLRAGDAIVKINDMDTSWMEHSRAKTEIVRCGNDFRLTIRRNAVNPIKVEPAPLNQIKPAMSFGPNDKLTRAAQFNASAAPLPKADFTVDKGESINIGGSHNRAPMPFNREVGSTMDYKAAKPANWQPGDYTKFMDPSQPQYQQQQPQQPPASSPTVTAVFHNPYNTPIGIYSDSNIFQEFQKQTRNILPPDQNRAGGYHQPQQAQYNHQPSTTSTFQNTGGYPQQQQQHHHQHQQPVRGVQSLSMRMLDQGINETQLGRLAQPPSVFDLKRGENSTGATVPRGFKSVQAPQALPPEQRHAPMRKEFEVKHVKESWIEPKF